MEDKEAQYSGEVSKASLVLLSGVVLPTQMVEAIGLVPDRSWERGAMRPGNRPDIRYRLNGVEYCGRLSSTSKWPDHLTDLVERLTPAKDRIRSLVGELDGGQDSSEVMSACVWISHTTPNATPHYIFSTDQLSFIAEIGASLGVSVYSDYRDEDDASVQPR